MSELERLRDRVAELEDIIGLTANLPRELIPREVTTHSATVRRLIGILLTRPFGDRDAVYDALYGARAESDQPCLKMMDVLICQARKGLKLYGIEIRTEWGRGWYLDAANKAKLRAIIDQINREQAAA